MHSSRMRTVCCSGRLLGGGVSAQVGVSTQGGVCLGGILCRGVSLRGCLARGKGVSCQGKGVSGQGEEGVWPGEGGVWPGGRGCLARGVCVCLGGVWLGVSAQGGAQGGVHLLYCGQIEACENITFPQLLLQTVKIL